MLQDAIFQWEEKTKKSAIYISKGKNNRTEMYSALEAEVIDPEDHSTSLNLEILSELKNADMVNVIRFIYWLNFY